jgi:hypothetical protein
LGNGLQVQTRDYTYEALLCQAQVNPVRLPPQKLRSEGAFSAKVCAQRANKQRTRKAKILDALQPGRVHYSQRKNREILRQIPAGAHHHDHHRTQRRDRLHPHARRSLPRARRRAPRRNRPRLRATQRGPRTGRQLRGGLRDEFCRPRARATRLRGQARRREPRRGHTRGAEAAGAAAPAQAQRPAPTPARHRPRRPRDRQRRTRPRPRCRGRARLDEQILQAAGELGYDAAKVRKWVNQKYEVTGGLDSLTPHDKREVLKIFQEQSGRAQQKAARK